MRDAADANLELAEIDAPAAGGPAPPAGSAGETLRRRIYALGLIVITAVATVTVMRSLGPAVEEGAAPPQVRARQVTFTGDVSRRIDLAADGRTAVYLTRDNREVVLLDLDGGGSRTVLSAPTGTTFEDVRWSPDSGVSS